MRVVIEVKGDRRFYPGTAHVTIDGEEVARLRADESFIIETHQGHSTQTKVKPPPEPVVGNGRQDCTECEGDESLCDGSECQK